MCEIDTLIISPKYRPFNDSLSDHTYYLLKELRLNLIEEKICLVTSDNTEIIKFAQNDNLIYPIMKEWDGFELLPLLKLIKKLKPKILLIQFSPQMYGRSGINFFFPLLIIYIRLFFKSKIHVVIHDIENPSKKDLRSMLVSMLQQRCLLYLITSSHKILTTTDYIAKKLVKYPFSQKKIHHFSIGSNIPISKVGATQLDFINIVIFGSLHYSKNPKAVFKAIAKYIELRPTTKIRFHIIGPNKNEILSIFNLENINLNRNLIEKLFFYGKLDESEVSKVFSNCHFSLNYYTEGITSKRSSVVAAIGHKLPVITHLSEYSDSIFFSKKCILVAGKSEQEFFKNFPLLLQRLEHMSNIEYQLLKDECNDFFEQEFQWNSIIKKYLSISSL